jgi:hypothetical protein
MRRLAQVLIWGFAVLGLIACFETFKPKPPAHCIESDDDEDMTHFSIKVSAPSARF